MTPEEKADPGRLNAAARHRIVQQVGCTPSQIDDVLQRFAWVKGLFSGLAEDARQGKAMPKTPEELVQRFGVCWDVCEIGVCVKKEHQ